MKRALMAMLVVAACLGGPAAASADPGLMFGFSDDGPKLEGAAAVAPARSLGAGAFRITVAWTPGRTGLSTTDVANLDRATSSVGELRLLVAVYSSAVSAPQDDVARDQFCAYARSVLARYPSINDLVIWNEPNLSYFWRPQFNADGTSAAPAAYEALLARCWDVLHAFRPNVNVIAPATAPRGNDDPRAVSNISHSPANFIRKLGEAYRASGRALPILDTVAQHVYGNTSAERPWRKHTTSGTIAEGDLDKLMGALSDAFSGTAQPLPGQCPGSRCVSIWYTEAGYQTRIDPDKTSLYVAAENEPRPVPDYAGGEPDSPSPFPDSLAPDQATQLADGIRLAYCQPHVGAFFNFLLWDEQNLATWQSGVFWFDRTPKDSYGVLRQTIEQTRLGIVDCSKFTRPPPPVSTAAPTISGTAQEGQTLTAGPGTWLTTAPLTYVYRWQRCDPGGTVCDDLPGATLQTYVPSTSDVASTLRVTVTADAGGGPSSATSQPTPQVVAASAIGTPTPLPPPPPPPPPPPVDPQLASTSVPPPLVVPPSSPVTSPPDSLAGDAARDTTPPRARALPSSGRRGRLARLRYAVSDDTGRARWQITVLRAGRPLGTLRGALTARRGKVATALWRARGARGLLRFCIAARDAAGNTSPRSCAPLRIR